MHDLFFLQDLAIVMTISACIMIVCRHFRLPVVLGYILAGILIGPHTPPFPLVQDLHNIKTMSEMGVIFLLFTIGLEFSLTKLKKVGTVSVIAATLEILLMLGIGFGLGRAFGWKFMDSLFLGAILCVSSTTIIAKILLETKKVGETFAQIILGILIVEDLLAIVIIAVLSGIAVTGSLEMAAIGIAMMKVGAFIAAILLAGFLIVPRYLRHVDRFKSPEMMTVSVLGLCFAGSLGAAKMGFSVALGAFLMGAIIAETRQAKAVVHQMESLRDMFTAIFFVSVGMMIKPSVLIELGGPILVITAVTILGKVISCSLATFLTGYNSEISLRVGLGLAQIGEFSFIIASLGQNTGVTSDFLYPVAVSVSAVTTLSTPFLMKNTLTIIETLQRVTPKPLSTFLGLYTAWVARVKMHARENPVEEKAFGAPEWMKLAGYAAGAVLIFFALSQARQRWSFVSDSFYWIAAGVLMLPMLIGAAAVLDGALWRVVSRRLRPSEKTHEIPRLIRRMLRFFMLCTAGFFFLVLAAMFTPALPWASALIGLIALSGFFMWGSIRKVHEKIEKVIAGIFDPDLRREEVNAAQKDLVRLIQEDYPGEVHTEDFMLPYKECGINRTLRDLELRSKTGASVVSIYRDPESIPNPPPDTRLLPGDVLLLMGQSDQLAAAVTFLQQKIKEPSAPMRAGRPRTQRVKLAAGCPACGCRIREVHLGRRTGVQILGLNRLGRETPSPDPDTILEAGDELTLFGWEDQLKQAVGFLEKQDNPPPGE